MGGIKTEFHIEYNTFNTDEPLTLQVFGTVYRDSQCVDGIYIYDQYGTEVNIEALSDKDQLGIDREADAALEDRATDVWTDSGHCTCKDCLD